MAITYVLADASAFRIDDPTFDGRMTILDLFPEWYGKRDIGERYRLLDPVLRTADIIALRGSSSDLVSIISRDPILKDQLRDKSVAVLSPFSGDERVAPNFLSVPGFQPIASLPGLKLVRYLEVLAHLNKSHALIQAENTHYDLPSGTHASGFIQLESTLSNPKSIDRISDWIFPFVDPGTGLLTDVGSVMPVLYNLRQMAKDKFGTLLPIDLMGSYPVETSGLQLAISQMRQRVGRKGKLLLVLSVNSSDRLARIFTNLVRNGRIVTICHSRRDDPPEFVDPLTRLPLERWEVNEKGRCTECAKFKTVAVRIRNGAIEFHPEQKTEVIKADPARASAKRSFWESVDRCDAIKLHFDLEYRQSKKTSARHHGVFIDCKRLANENAFRAQCLSKLRELIIPDIVLVPDHSNSLSVVELIKEAYGPACDRVLVVPTERFSDEAIREVVGAKKVLIADDGIVTGTTVVGIKHEIYRVCQPKKAVPALDCFAMIFRPASQEAVKSLARPFYGEDRKPHISYGELILLPEPTRQNCPWCVESELIGELARSKNEEVSRLVRARIHALEGELDVPPLYGTVMPDATELRTESSYFGNLGSKTAFAAAVSVAQSISTELGDFRVVDLQQIIDSYFDPVLLAGFLRTFQLKHLRFAATEEPIAQSIIRLPGGLAYPGIVGELAYAAVEGKVPRRAVMAVLEQLSENDPHINMLKQLIP